MNNLGVKTLTETAKLPTRSYENSLGYDLYVDSVELIALTRVVVHTGVALRLPGGLGGLICDRSSMARLGYFVTAGVIDNDYHGEVMVIMNMPDGYPLPQKGQKIAQLLLIPTPQAEIVKIEELPSSERGDKGFGSSGK